MDRRAFLTATGAAAATAATVSSVHAEGYRRCDQIHDKLTPDMVDKWQVDLPMPGILSARNLKPTSANPSPPIGDVSQGVAPEFFWAFPAAATGSPPNRSVPGDPDPRSDDIYRLPAVAQAGELQFAELSTKDVVREVVPGYLTRLLCYGFGDHFETPGPIIEARLGVPLVVRLKNEIDPCLMLDVSMHQHGGHVPAHSDGHPGYFVEPRSIPGQGKQWAAGVRDYYYPNPLPLNVDQKPNKNGEGAGAPGSWNWEKRPGRLGSGRKRRPRCGITTMPKISPRTMR